MYSFTVAVETHCQPMTGDRQPHWAYKYLNPKTIVITLITTHANESIQGESISSLRAGVYYDSNVQGHSVSTCQYTLAGRGQPQWAY